MQKSRGMTLLQFVISVCVIVVLIGLTSYKAWMIMAEGERTAMLQVLNYARLSLTLSTLKQESKLVSRECVNPMAFVSTPPSNYLGERKEPPPSLKALGQWYFDTSCCRLVYQWRFVYTLDHLRMRPDISEFVVKKRDPSEEMRQKPFQKLFLVPVRDVEK